jgi:hypothetical protein
MYYVCNDQKCIIYVCSMDAYIIYINLCIIHVCIMNVYIMYACIMIYAYISVSRICYACM